MTHPLIHGTTVPILHYLLIEFVKMQIPSVGSGNLIMTITVGLATIGVCVFCGCFGGRIFIFPEVFYGIDQGKDPAVLHGASMRSPL